MTQGCVSYLLHISRCDVCSLVLQVTWYFWKTRFMSVKIQCVFLEGVYRASQATLRKRGFSYLGGVQYRNTHIILGEEAMNTVCSNKIKN